ncbi:MAG: cytochrome b5 domain-containing protein, partial [Methanobacteriota archaeon]
AGVQPARAPAVYLPAHAYTCALIAATHVQAWLQRLSSGWRPPGAVPPSVACARRITASELKCHATSDDCWIALRGKVYDVTHYMAAHPGGVRQLLRCAGWWRGSGACVDYIAAVWRHPCFWGAPHNALHVHRPCNA